jgi:hypothetical protein
MGRWGIDAASKNAVKTRREQLANVKDHWQCQSGEGGSWIGKRKQAKMGNMLGYVE